MGNICDAWKVVWSEDAEPRMGRSVKTGAHGRVVLTLCWRAELTIGTRHGYTGPEVIRPMDLIPYIEACQQRPDPWFAVIVWACGTVIGPSFLQ